MRVRLLFAQESLTADLPDGSVVLGPKTPPAVASDVRAAMRAAAEEPLRFEPLRRALTPDDRLALIWDRSLARPAELLAGLLDHLGEAGISPGAVTVVSASDQPFPGLPAEFSAVQFEAHDPSNREKLAYLSATGGGERVYLSRTVVDADQVIVVSGRRYDGDFGYSGAEATVYPAFAGADAVLPRRAADRSGVADTPARLVAEEAAGLLGSAFYFHVLEGAGDSVERVLAGLSDTSADGRQMLDRRWRWRASRPYLAVIATLSGDPARHTFTDVARAAACAARVTAPEGHIFILSRANPELGEGAGLLREVDNPVRGLARLDARLPHDRAARQWADACARARVVLFSGLAEDVTEGLYATALTDPAKLGLLVGDAPVLVIPDAHKALVEVRPG